MAEFLSQAEAESDSTARERLDALEKLEKTLFENELKLKDQVRKVDKERRGARARELSVKRKGAAGRRYNDRAAAHAAAYASLINDMLKATGGTR